MNKAIIVLCAFLAVAHAQPEDQVDNYIQINRDQYHRVVEAYNAKLSYFGDHFKGRVEAVAVQKELVVASIVHTEERLAPLVLLNGFTKHCVSKYRARVANVEVTKAAITKCELVAVTELNSLLEATVKVRDTLVHHLDNVFEGKLEQCAKNAGADYTSCVATVVFQTNKFAHENQKSFEYEYEAAECLAKAHVKKVVDCVYDIEINVFTDLGQFEALLDKCLIGEDECQPCPEHTCAEARNVYGHFENQTIANPLYGRTDSPKCLMLNIQ